MKKIIASFLFAFLFGLIGCGRTDLMVEARASDCGSHATDTVSAPDAQPDTVADVGHDASPDVGTDVPSDAAADASSDVPVADAGTCGRFHPGDLIRSPSFTAVYYIASDCARYVFPNETTYFTWYTDFSRVQMISDMELATIPIRGNVTIRPGTWLIKITTDPRVYAITPCGVLHWIPSEMDATRFYGPSWAMRVRDVPDGFFVNYRMGYDVRSLAGAAATPYPDGTLISPDGTSRLSIIQDGHRRLFAPGAFEANGFRREFVVTVDDTTWLNLDEGPDVVGREPLLADTIACPRPVR